MRPAFLMLLVTCSLGIGTAVAQRMPDAIRMASIRTVRLHPVGDPLSYPILTLNGPEQLELNFDDMDADVKTYYYTFELCNADWTPVQMNFFDYVRGYTRVRITNYRNAAGTLTRYTHYNAVFPDRNCVPIRSGNYLLKVFVNGDTSRLAFTRRFLVVDNRMKVAAQVQQPFNQRYFQTHHRLQVSVNTHGADVRYPQQQVRVAVLQNYRWDNRLNLANPTFIRQEMLEYSNESEMMMPGGKEWRWVNLRSFRLLGDRVRMQRNTDSSFSLFVQEERPRLPQQYFYFRDANGMSLAETLERVNPHWGAEYGKVHFRFHPPDGMPYAGRDLYVFGDLTAYGRTEGARMRFNPEKGIYETELQLKQGYYDYVFATRDSRQPDAPFMTDLTEADHWETENVYMVLVYYRELGGRYDQLLGMTRISSQFRRAIR